MKPVLGPHAHTTRARETRVTGMAARPRDGRPGEGKRQTPDTPQNGERSPAPGRHPVGPAARNASRGTRVKGAVMSPHTCTPAHSKWAADPDPDRPPRKRAAG